MKHQKLIAATVVSFAITYIMSCSKNDDKATPAPLIGIQLASNATLGNILTDSIGKTLYFFLLMPTGSRAAMGDALPHGQYFIKRTQPFLLVL